MIDLDKKSCLDRIREKYSDLKVAEQKAAKYILENPRDIIHFSITELADASKASETTIFRLCNKLAYKGYQDLKINLAGAIVEPMENIHEEIKENDDMYMIMHKVLNSNVSSIEKTMKMNKSKELEKAVELILSADQLMFFGMGGSAAIATDAYHKFIRTGMNCVCNSDSHWQAMFASMAKENDVLIAFTNSGSNKDLIETIEIARKNGVKVISVTSHVKSPIAKVSDIVLESYGTETMYRSEAMESRITALILIDCLYLGVALKRKDVMLNTLEKIREGIATKRY